MFPHASDSRRRIGAASNERGRAPHIMPYDYAATRGFSPPRSSGWRRSNCSLPDVLTNPRATRLLHLLIVVGVRYHGRFVGRVDLLGRLLIGVGGTEQPPCAGSQKETPGDDQLGQVGLIHGTSTFDQCLGPTPNSATRRGCRGVGPPRVQRTVPSTAPILASRPAVGPAPAALVRPWTATAPGKQSESTYGTCGLRRESSRKRAATAPGDQHPASSSGLKRLITRSRSRIAMPGCSRAIDATNDGTWRGGRRRPAWVGMAAATPGALLAARDGKYPIRVRHTAETGLWHIRLERGYDAPSPRQPSWVGLLHQPSDGPVIPSDPAGWRDPATPVRSPLTILRTVTVATLASKNKSTTDGTISARRTKEVLTCRRRRRRQAVVRSV